MISQFLPKQLNEKETENIIKKIISEKNLLSLKDMGTLMGDIKNNHSGAIDMSLAGKIAKSLLNH